MSSTDALASPSLSNSFHDRLQKTLKSLGIKVILGEKVQDLEIASSVKSFKTDKGTEISADFVLVCVGMGKPYSEFMDGSLLNDKGDVRITPTFQLDESAHSHMFALGDVAATGFAKMAVSLYAQIPVVSENIISLIKNGEKAKLKTFKASPANMMVVGLGPKTAVTEIPYVPGFVSDFLGKSLKQKDYFLGKTKGELNN